MKYWIFVGLFLWSSPILGQEQYKNDIGSVFGVNFTFGTGLNRIGVFAKGYGHADVVQFNVEARWNYDFKGWGHGLKNKETQLKFGVVGTFGQRYDFLQQQFIQILNHQTQRNFSLGYAYTIYKDNNETDQVTGTIMLQAGRWQLILENDAFSFTPHDRYRTAATKLQYLYDENTQVAFNLMLWIGNPFSENFKVYIDERYPSRFGYKDIQDAKFTNFSHGIVNLQINRLFEYGQIGQVNIGADWEYFRHFFQNWVIHDLLFLPQSWVEYLKIGNPHIPILDTNGNPYLFKSNQMVKKGVFFGNIGLNPSLFY